MKNNTAEALVKKTKEDYCKIAQAFSKTRQWIWPELLDYLNSVKKGERILDFGCGNARLVEFFQDKGIDYMGLDFCENFIEKAKEKYNAKSIRFIVGDVLNAPLPDASFDKIFSIAVLHHIPSQKLREQFFTEIKRLLKKDGIAVITVWNLHQRKYLPYYVKSIINKLFGKYKMDWGDVLIPWKEGQGTPIQRYVHIFGEKELIFLAEKAGLQVEKSGCLSRNGKKTNLILVVKK